MKHFNYSKVLLGGMVAVALLATGSFAFAEESKGGVSAATSRTSAKSGSKAVSTVTVRPATTIDAENVAAGTFGAAVGNGNYIFPGTLGIGGEPGIGTQFEVQLGENRFAVSVGDGPVTTVLAGVSPRIYMYDTNSQASVAQEIGLDGYRVAAGNGDLRLETEGGIVLLGENTGNLGIGTSDPAYKLDVAGMIRSSAGGYRFPDGTVQTTAASGTRIDMVMASMPARAACTTAKAGQLALDTSAQKLYVCLGNSWAAVQLER